MLSRRGFLGTLAAAATGAAAAFDPISKLWVPKALAADAVPELAIRRDAFQLAMAPLSDSGVQRVIDTQLELNDLALRVAKQMTARLEHHKSVMLRQVVYELSGQNHLDGLIRMPAPVERLGPQGSAEFLEKVYPGISSIQEAVGRFEPSDHRVMTTMAYGVGDPIARKLADDLTGKVWGFDMFVPLTAELRPGEPFTEDMAIGVATDPDSGLMVRVLRFEQDRRGGTLKALIGAEMVGGEWAPQVKRHVRKPPRYDKFFNVIKEG